MDVLYTWVKNIVFFLLLIKVLENLITGDSIRKYFKLFSGIILIIILIQPLLNYNQLFQNLSLSVTKHDIDMNLSSLERNSLGEEMQNELTMKLYKDKLNQHITQILKAEGINVQSVEVKVNEDAESEAYGMVNEIYLTLIPEGKTSSSSSIKIDKIDINSRPQDTNVVKSSEQILLEKKAKNIIYNFYNLSSDNIHITIEAC